MKNELISRYIYAVVRRLPAKTQADVRQELQTLIADMLEARCGEVTPSDKDVRVVLTELGAPGEMSAQYAGDEQQALIGGRYFHIYRRMLVIGLPCLAALMIVINVVQAFFRSIVENVDAIWVAKVIGTTIAQAVESAFIAFGIVTLVFAILERTKATLFGGDFLDSLPELPRRTFKIPLAGTIARIVLTSLLTGVLLGMPQIIGLWLADGSTTPLFDTITLRWAWPIVVVWAVIAIGQAVYIQIEGRHTRRVAIVSSVASLAKMCLAGLIFGLPMIVNPGFVAAVQPSTPLTGAELTSLISHLSVALWVLIYLLEILAIWLRTRPLSPLQWGDDAAPGHRVAADDVDASFDEPDEPVAATIDE